MVVNKSTVPVGSGDYVSMLIRDDIQKESREQSWFPVAAGPEFLIIKIPATNPCFCQ